MHKRKSTQVLGILAAFCAGTALVSAADELVYPTGVFAQPVAYQSSAVSDGGAAEDAAPSARSPASQRPAEAPASQPALAKPPSEAEQSLTDRFVALGVAAALLAFAFLRKTPGCRPAAMKQAESEECPPAADSVAVEVPAKPAAIAQEEARPVKAEWPAVAYSSAVPAIRGNIVVPVDFSAHSEFAVRLALVWAKPGDRLRIVYCIDLDNAFPSANLTPSDFIAIHPAFAKLGGETAYHWSQLPWVVVLPQAIEIVERWAVDAFTRLRQALPMASRESLEFEVLHGDPVNQIVSFSEEAAAKLIVLVAHKHSLVERLIDGSHADKLLHASRIPVIVACEPVNAEPSLPQEIFITTDYSPESLPVFLVLKDLIQEAKPNIRVLTVETAHERHPKASALLEGLEQAFRSSGLPLVNVKIAALDVEDGILKYVQAHPPQLIAMSSHGRMGFAELIHPSVAKAILHESGVPILVVHSRSMPTAETSGSLSDFLRIVTG